MKAIRVNETGGPGVMVMEELPDLHPGEGEVVVRMAAAGVNPVDTYIRAGSFYSPDVPYTPGADGAGTVKELGTGVGGIGVGDRVCVAGSISGTYAQETLCKASQVHRLPDRVSFAQGAAVGVPYGTAWIALNVKARATSGETVLVHGASGAVGIAAVQIAKSLGMKVIGTAGTDAGMQLARQQGATHVFDHHEDGYFEQILEASDGGVDVVLEMLANVNLAKDPDVCAKNARIVVIGSRGPIEINPRSLMAKDLTITAMLLMNQPPDNMNAAHEAIVGGLESGEFAPVVREEIPLAEAWRAHELVMQPGALGKIVLTID